jgi:tetratricopeptide (TPR) repeat protein
MHQRSDHHHRPAQASGWLARSVLALALTSSLAATGCNMFASWGAKARGTVNSITKRNVDFDRPAPAEEDLEGIRAVAVADLEGESTRAAKISAYLSSQLSDSGRFALVEAGSPGSDGTALIRGKVVDAKYDERVDAQSAKCGDKACETRTRIGTAVVSVTFSLVDAGSNRVLLQKTLEDRREAKTSATDSDPPSIDGEALLDEAAHEVADDFFAAVSPHVVTETVFFETDGKAKALKEGAQRALNGDLEGAIASFEEGLAEAEAKDDDNAIAKARYDLGLALVIKGEYDEGLELLELAQEPKARRNWTDTVLAAQRWKTDAERARAQFAANEGEPPTHDPKMRASEDPEALESVKGLGKLLPKKG